MQSNRAHAIAHNHAIDYGQSISVKAKLKDYGQLIKFRLNLTVVLSTFVGYLLGSPANIDWFGLVAVVTGGFLTVGAANGINQIIERDSDKLMRRTENRPVATNRMTVTEAAVACLIMGILGVGIIGYFLNGLSALLSLLSLCLYGFVYTPLKKITPFAVYIGAIPGALPPIIGYVASSGTLDSLGWILFILQFVWQFPHFYSIAWILDDDYKRAGLKLMPVGTSKNKSAALQISIFSLLLIPISFMPLLYGCGSFLTCVFLSIASALFAWPAMKLFNSLSNKDARKLMFFSISYLPVIFVILILGRWL